MIVNQRFGILYGKVYQKIALFIAIVAICLVSFGVLFRFPSYSYIKAITYYGDRSSWVFNFWSSDLTQINQDFNRIRSEGFNCIVLVVPWGEFQPGLKPITYNKYALTRLKYVIQVAYNHKLDVVLRISYLWDLYPKEQLPNISRFESLFTNPSIKQSWLRYIAKLNQTTSTYGNVRFSFISWEDFWWPYMDLVNQYNNTSDSVVVANKIGYQAWLQSHLTLNSIDKIYKSSFNSYSQVPLPNNLYEKILEYRFFDYWFSNMYKLAQKKYPQLTIEARVDFDPYIDSSGQFQWYKHFATYSNSKVGILGIYYAPYMGATVHNLSYTQTTTLLKNKLRETLRYTNGAKLFIDQFNFYDNSPGYTSNAVITPGQRSRFLINAAPVLKKYTMGYALWTYRNTTGNAVYNPSFALLGKAWRLSGAVSFTNNHRYDYAQLKNSSSVSQNLPMILVPSSTQKPVFSITARSLKKNASIQITVGSETFNLSLTTRWKIIRHTIDNASISNNTRISIKDAGVSVCITKVELYYPPKAQSMILGERGRPLRDLNAIEQLNKLL